MEAWIRNVPTFVWNRGYFEYKSVNNKVFGNISAPYLTQECGMFFEGKEDFINKFQNFIKNLVNFTPREYVLRNFTDEISTQNYLRFVKEIQEK